MNLFNKRNSSHNHAETGLESDGILGQQRHSLEQVERARAELPGKISEALRRGERTVTVLALGLNDAYRKGLFGLRSHPEGRNDIHSVFHQQLWDELERAGHRPFIYNHFQQVYVGGPIGGVCEQIRLGSYIKIIVG